jgi:hypothetical protein
MDACGFPTDEGGEEYQRVRQNRLSDDQFDLDAIEQYVNEGCPNFDAQPCEANGTKKHETSPNLDLQLSISANNRPITASEARWRVPIVAHNTIQTLDDVEHQLRDYEEQFQHFSFPAGQIRIEADRLIAGDRVFHLDSSGTRRLCRRLGAPNDYLFRLGRGMRAQVLEHHLRTGMFVDRKMTASNSRIIERNGIFVDLGRDDLHVLTCADVLQALKEGVGADATQLQVHALSVTDERIDVDLVSSRLSQDVRVGDAVRAGIHLEHSLLGEQATVVATFILRLVCRNGLVHRDCVNHKRSPRTRRLENNRSNARELQQDQIRRLAAGTWDHLFEKLEAIRRLQHEAVDAPAMLEQFVRRSRLYSHSVMEHLRTAWQTEGSEPTRFGVLNALTRVATHSAELTVRQRRMLSQLAGIFANHRTHICPRCFSVMLARSDADPQAGEGHVH